MTQPLDRLVYHSRNRIAGSPEEVALGLETILAGSRRNNPRAGVTGALMFNNGCFAQVLEGPRPAVESIFERIQNDARHGDVSLLFFETVERRTFAGWSMAFIGRGAADAARYGHIAADTGFDPSTLDGDGIFQTMRRLAAQQELIPA